MLQRGILVGQLQLWGLRVRLLMWFGMNDVGDMDRIVLDSTVA